FHEHQWFAAFLSKSCKNLRYIILDITGCDPHQASFATPPARNLCLYNGAIRSRFDGIVRPQQDPVTRNWQAVAFQNTLGVMLDKLHVAPVVESSSAMRAASA